MIKSLIEWKNILSDPRSNAEDILASDGDKTIFCSRLVIGSKIVAFGQNGDELTGFYPVVWASMPVAKLPTQAPRRIAVLGLPASLAGMTPQEALNKLSAEKKLSLDQLLTFGLVNTPIIDNQTGKRVAYISFWQGKQITICRVVERDVELLRGLEDQKAPTSSRH